MQGALLAMAMVLMQCVEERESRVATFRAQLDKIIHDKHEDAMTKMGAILATGLLDAGGRNVTISLRSRSGKSPPLSLSATSPLPTLSSGKMPPFLFLLPSPLSLSAASPFPSLSSLDPQSRLSVGSAPLAAD